MRLLNRLLPRSSKNLPQRAASSRRLGCRCAPPPPSLRLRPHRPRRAIQARRMCSQLRSGLPEAATQDNRRSLT
jgi:hypothetical protein